MINSRVTIFTNTDVHSLSEDINTFIKWQEAIGNIINDIKLSTCESSCEAMVIWQMSAESGAIDIGEFMYGVPMYIVKTTIEGVKLTINIDDTRIIQQFIDMKQIIGACQILALDDDGETKVIYERAVPKQPALKIPRWRKETEEE